MLDPVAASAHSKGEPLNRLLVALPDVELQRLQRHLRIVHLEAGRVLFDAGEPAERVYFLDSGVASLTTAFENRVAVGVGVVGREGAVGAIPVLLGGATTIGRSRVLVPGSARTVEVSALRRALRGSSRLRAACESYSRGLLAQMLQAVACNKLHTVEQRFARWLLMCADRADDGFELTRDCLAEMLDAPRSRFNIVARTMQEAGLIAEGRGAITVVDRPALEKAACECYRILRQRSD